VTTPTAQFDQNWILGFAEPALASLFTIDADLSEMRRFEAELAKAEAAEGLIPADAAAAIAATCSTFVCDKEGLREGFGRDGLIVPEFVRQLKQAVPEPFRQQVHFGTTSQDLIDTSLLIRLKHAVLLIDAGLVGLIAAFDGLAAAHGSREMMAHTRMQRARPVSLADKISAWCGPLARHRQRLAEMLPRVFVTHMGGAVGNRRELEAKGQAIADRLADALGLARAPTSRHSERDSMAEAANWLALVAGGLGKFGQDIAILAMNEIGDVRFTGGGISSAMKGKSNPVKAELLVTLARFTATLISGMAQSLVHENERSGSAWSLEWLLLPQMAVATSASVNLAEQLLASLDFSGT
jgi:3-carboxy-cis,cis-muconate cycloisomerase